MLETCFLDNRCLCFFHTECICLKFYLTLYILTTEILILSVVSATKELNVLDTFKMVESIQQLALSLPLSHSSIHFLLSLKVSPLSFTLTLRDFLYCYSNV